MAKKNAKAGTELTVEEKLKALYDLQQVVSEIDRIRNYRGELPLEVQDLEDEIAGLQTRLNNYEAEIKKLNETIQAKNNEIKESEMLIKKYEAQQANVRNNREFDSLSKEIEFQTLEIELCNKQIEKFKKELETKQKLIEAAKEQFEERKKDLESKKAELDEIINETKVEEEKLLKKAESIKKNIEERLLTAFERIRKNARNGLAVVTIQRDACGGCFNKIPPQRQLDIRSRKKVIVCEYCGRILVDPEIGEK
jgi:predicted  nucleic acid-binding Zn-ribbon protein